MKNSNGHEMAHFLISNISDEVEAHPYKTKATQFYKYVSDVQVKNVRNNTTIQIPYNTNTE